MEVRHQPRLAGDQLEQGVVDLDAVQRRQAQALEARLRGKQALAEAAKPAFIVRNVDAGEDDLLRPAVDLPRDGVPDRFERQRTAWPTRLPDRAEGAAVVAAGLDGDETFHLVHEAG